MLNANPSFFLDGTPSSSSLDARLDIVSKAAPELAATAAAKASQCGAVRRPTSPTSSSRRAQKPGPPARTSPSPPSSASAPTSAAPRSSSPAAPPAAPPSGSPRTSPRTTAARATLTAFCGPREDDTFETLIPQALFGDGAAAVVIGADHELPVGERATFEMVAASQTTIPGTERMLNMRLGEGGIAGDVSSSLPSFAAEHLERCLVDALAAPPLAGVGGGVEEGKRRKWNELFWVVHPGSRGILDHIDVALRLEAEKLAASRAVVREYGNMMSATVIFVLNELRRRMEEGDAAETEWGVMVGFGPGFTVETMLLHVTKQQ
ncbi:hypothetical protein HU200_016363 [Digitaria exilis]|uniref:Chalcone synthase n=1 Tax=Digitaria exilis TaxID=1010633 RepID=A0A835KIL4_9POAL|nr:hypothetical protein HU200_016363 [Digitaria exilis]